MTGPEFKITKEDINVAGLSDERLTSITTLALERNDFSLVNECVDEVVRRGLSIK